MKHVKKSVLLWYTPHEMYDLVTRIEDYPKFLPWCESSQVLEVHEDGLTARMGLAYRGVRHAFTTRNVLVPDKQVVIGLVDGPFSLLDGNWQFIALGGGAEGAPPQGSRTELDLRYAFSSTTLEKLVSPVFDRIAETFVDSFVARAKAVYGER